MTLTKISLIIPVLNEASRIKSTLAAVQNAANLEVIVVDGGSQDETVAIATSLGVQVISAAAGRACQMNAGAAVATGDILLFLHGDTRLPAGFEAMVRQALGEDRQAGNFPVQNSTPPPAALPLSKVGTEGVIAGAFELGIEGHFWGRVAVEKIVNWRSRILGMPYGDQAIFLKAPVFQEIGGFPNMPIMEDFELMLRLRRLGRIAIISTPVLTSGRRWQKLGVLKTTLINQVVIIGYFLGVPPSQLACWYRHFRL